MSFHAREKGYLRKAKTKGPHVRASFLSLRRRGLGVAEEGRRLNLSAVYPASRQRQSGLGERFLSSNMQSFSRESGKGSTSTERLSSSVATSSLDIQYPRDLFTIPPTIVDDLVTESSRLQAETIAECLPYLKRARIASSGDDDNDDDQDDSSSAVSSSTSDVPSYAPWIKTNSGNKDGHFRNLPRLNCDAHISFLRDKLGSYPWYYAAMDASRPWVFYWALNGLVLLGVDVGEYVDR